MPNAIKIAILSLLLFAGTIFAYQKLNHQTTETSALVASVPVSTSTPETTNPDEGCADLLLAQSQYLEKEKQSEKFTFSAFPVKYAPITKPTDLDTKSNEFAREFRTMIRSEMAKEGVNFAGHYSVVSVGMTGWGASYYIVDRLNGKAYIFPYLMSLLDVRKDSNLLIMDSKPLIKKILDDPGSPCTNTGSMYRFYPELRPFYFLWENNKLKLLGPTSIRPPVNPFWKGWGN